MKPVILKVSFALLLVLALCTVASYHIERIMMAKVTVSLPQDGIVRGVPCEATVLPLSSLTMQDGNTGVYIIDYVEGRSGKRWWSDSCQLLCRNRISRTFPLGICWISGSTSYPPTGL